MRFLVHIGYSLDCIGGYVTTDVLKVNTEEQEARDLTRDYIKGLDNSELAGKTFVYALEEKGSTKEGDESTLVYVFRECVVLPDKVFRELMDLKEHTFVGSYSGDDIIESRLAEQK